MTDNRMEITVEIGTDQCTALIAAINPYCTERHPQKVGLTINIIDVAEFDEQVSPQEALRSVVTTLGDLFCGRRVRWQAGEDSAIDSLTLDLAVDAPNIALQMRFVGDALLRPGTLVNLAYRLLGSGNWLFRSRLISERADGDLAVPSPNGIRVGNCLFHDPVAALEFGCRPPRLPSGKFLPGAAQ